MEPETKPQRVRLKGALDMTTVDQVRTTLKPLLISKNPIADLSDVTYMDSAALSVFLEYQRLLSARSKVLKIVTRSTAILHLFKMTSLDRHFEIFPTADEAIASAQTAD